MEVTVALEARYWITPDGSVWSQAGMARQFWERYLEVFDKVRIVARAMRVERASPEWLPVSAENIEFHALPDYQGPGDFLRHSLAFRKAIRAAVPKQGAVILRGPAHVANCLRRQLRDESYPFALEVLGDPSQVFAPGVVEHPFRRFFRWYFSSELRRQCREACGVAYVTRKALQLQYPNRYMSAGVSDVELPVEALLGGGLPSTHYSSIDLDSAGIALSGRKPKKHGPWQIVMVGSLAQMYKGPDVLIEAVSRCVSAGVDVSAVIVGDGKFRAAMEALAENLGVKSRITFAGQVTAGEPVRRILDAADLFVLPSRTEGLPRALVEAMARALPCIGSDVGGIPELLEKEELVPPGDAAALATKIMAVLSNPERVEAMSLRNLEQSKEYRDIVLAERRRNFYRHVREYTNEWTARRNRARV
jgi:glycosyltransferase involved in cell wall biosynthesis